MVIMIISAVVIGIFTYLIIFGSDSLKSDYERKLEDDAQMSYIEKWKEQHKNEVRKDKF